MEEMISSITLLVSLSLSLSRARARACNIHVSNDASFPVACAFEVRDKIRWHEFTDDLGDGGPMS